jgi:hypothetical protein
MKTGGTELTIFHPGKEPQTIWVSEETLAALLKQGLEAMPLADLEAFVAWRRQMIAEQGPTLRIVQDD